MSHELEVSESRGMSEKKQSKQSDESDRRPPDAARADAVGAQMSNTVEEREELATEHPPALSPALQGHLGRQLRTLYGELVNEPIPDKFTKLLEELARKQGKQE